MGLWINGVNCTEWGTTNVYASSATATSFTFETDIIFSTLRVEFSDYSSMSSSAQGITQGYFDYYSTSNTQTDTITCNNGPLPGKSLRIWLDYLWDQPYVTVNFISPPTVSKPSDISITQNTDGTVTFKWKACTGSGGSGSVSYEIRETSNGTQVWSGTSTSATVNIASKLWYGSITFNIYALYSGISDFTQISKTLYKPSINAPTSPKVNPAAGKSTTLSWTAAKLNYTTGTLNYTIYKNGTSIGTSSSTSYVITEEVASTWGTSAVTLTIKATATSLSNTASGTSLTSGASSGVSFTYQPYTACKSPTTFAVDDELSIGSTTLRWSGASGGTSNAITGYAIEYQDSGSGTSWPGTWVSLGETTSTSMTVQPPIVAGFYRRFRIQVRGAAGSGYYSSWTISSNMLRKGLEPFPDFTDPTIVAQSTKIKAVHMTELQNRVNTLLNFEGKTPVTFTTIIANQTKLKDWSKHVLELRSAINQLNNISVTWIEIVENRPRADVMEQLRKVVNEYKY